MKKKIVSMLMTCALIAVTAAGCGSSSNDSGGGTSEKGGDGVTTIKFGIHVADPEAQEKVTYGIVQAFNQKYEGQYKVEFEAADTESHTKNMKLQASDGTLPHIFWMDSSEAPEYAKAGYLTDLSAFLSEYSDVDQALDESAKAAFKSDIQYGLPYQCNVEGFFYNKEIFEELSIDVPVNGTTFEQLLEMTAACNAAGYTTIAQGCMNSSYAIWGYLALMDRYGYSDYIYDILDGKEKFNNPNMSACFEKLETLGKSNAFANNMATQEYFDAKELFITGKAAILNTGAWDCAELDERMGDTVGFWWGPTFSDSTYNQQAAMKVPSAPLCVSSKIEENEKIKDAVYKFLEFYYSEEAAKMSYEGSVFPSTNYTGIEAFDTQYALAEVMKSIDEGWVSPASQPDQILTSAVQSQLYDSIFGVLLGNYTPDEALNKIDQQMEY